MHLRTRIAIYLVSQSVYVICFPRARSFVFDMALGCLLVIDLFPHVAVHLFPHLVIHLSPSLAGGVRVWLFRIHVSPLTASQLSLVWQVVSIARPSSIIFSLYSSHLSPTLVGGTLAV